MGGMIRARRVIETLPRLIAVHGALLHLRSDKGPEFLRLAILLWLAVEDIATALNGPRLTVAKRCPRKLQWQVPRGMLERALERNLGPGSNRKRGIADRLHMVRLQGAGQSDEDSQYSLAIFRRFVTQQTLTAAIRKNGICM